MNEWQSYAQTGSSNRFVKMSGIPDDAVLSSVPYIKGIGCPLMLKNQKKHNALCPHTCRAGDSLHPPPHPPAISLPSQTSEVASLRARRVWGTSTRPFLRRSELPARLSFCQGKQISRRQCRTPGVHGQEYDGTAHIHGAGIDDSRAGQCPSNAGQAVPRFLPRDEVSVVPSASGRWDFYPGWARLE